MFGASSETGKYPSACGWFRFTIPVRGKAHVLILRSDFEIRFWDHMNLCRLHILSLLLHSKVQHRMSVWHCLLQPFRSCSITFEGCRFWYLFVWHLNDVDSDICLSDSHPTESGVLLRFAVCLLTYYRHQSHSDLIPKWWSINVEVWMWWALCVWWEVYLIIESITTTFHTAIGHIKSTWTNITLSRKV